MNSRARAITDKRRVLNRFFLFALGLERTLADER